MIISEEEQMERRKLVGFCERHQEWYNFVDNPGESSSRRHPDCGEMPSSRIGFQVTTQRTFNPRTKKMTQAQLKKMGGRGA